MEYAQFLELELFTRFGGMSDARVKAQLARGERLRALLAQPQYAPLRLADEMALAFALREGLLDAVSVSAIGALRAALPAWLEARAGGVVAEVERDRELSDANAEHLRTALADLVARHRQ